MAAQHGGTDDHDASGCVPGRRITPPLPYEALRPATLESQLVGAGRDTGETIGTVGCSELPIDVPSVGIDQTDVRMLESCTGTADGS